MLRLITILLCMGTVLYAQKSTYTSIVLTEDFPDVLLPKGAAEVGFLMDEENHPAAFGYAISETEFKPVAKLGSEFSQYVDGRDHKSYYKDDTLVFWYREPYKNAQTFTCYEWDGKKLSLIEQVKVDPSADSIAEARAELKKGEIKHAAELYNSVQYPTGYYQEHTVAYNILWVAHFHAMDLYRSGNYKEAATLMEDAFIYYMNKNIMEAASLDAFNTYMHNNFLQEQTDSIGPWLADYGEFVYLSGDMEKAVSVNGYVSMIYPRLAEPYLYLGEALYALERADEAKEPYGKYVGIMTARGEEALIDSKIMNRIK